MKKLFKPTFFDLIWSVFAVLSLFIVSLVFTYLLYEILYVITINYSNFENILIAIFSWFLLIITIYFLIIAIVNNYKIFLYKFNKNVIILENDNLEFIWYYVFIDFISIKNIIINEYHNHLSLKEVTAIKLEKYNIIWDMFIKWKNRKVTKSRNIKLNFYNKQKLVLEIDTELWVFCKWQLKTLFKYLKNNYKLINFENSWFFWKNIQEEDYLN